MEGNLLRLRDLEIARWEDDGGCPGNALEPGSGASSRGSRELAALARMEGDLLGHPDRELFDELRTADPAVEGRLRRLEAERAGLKEELRKLRLRLADERPLTRRLDKRRRELGRRIKALKRAEDHLLLDAYMTDTGGEGE